VIIMAGRGYSSSYKPQDRAYYTRARTAIVKNGTELKCSRCGTDKRIEIHHKDEDITNNSIDNLIPLCKNCHFLIHGISRSFN